MYLQRGSGTPLHALAMYPVGSLLRQYEFDCKWSQLFCLKWYPFKLRSIFTSIKSEILPRINTERPRAGESGHNKKDI